MKKIISIIITVMLCFLISGCSFNNETLNNPNVYTTSYPINYLVKTLYGSYAKNVSSIYPSDCDINNYEIPQKKFNEYAKGDLFVYNGLTNEKEIAKSLINKNRNLLIIDVSYGLTLANDITELWLSPNNYLMLAKNIKDNLEEYINNKTITESINDNYNDFEEKISIMDASLHSLGKNSKKTIIVSNDTFKFLENYGFTVISLEDPNNQKEIKINNIKNNFKNKKYSSLLVANTDIDNELVKEIKDSYSPTIYEIDTLTISLNDDYFNVMNSFIEIIKNITNE